MEKGSWGWRRIAIVVLLTVAGAHELVGIFGGPEPLGQVAVGLAFMSFGLELNVVGARERRWLMAFVVLGALMIVNEVLSLVLEG